MLHNEARKLVLEAWDKTHNVREIAKYFSVNESTVYRLIEERARTGSYETRTQLRGRKTILTEKQHHDILELVQEQPDITMKEFARNIKTEAEFPNSQRNMLYRKRAFSGSCAAQQQTEKIRTEYNHIAAVICRRNIGFQEGNIALFFISDAFFFVFPCISERCCYNKGK